MPLTIPQIEETLEMDWHSMPTELVLTKLNADTHGLSETEVISRRLVFGKNELAKAKVITVWEIIVHQLLNPLIFILLAAAIASLLIGEFSDTIFIGVVIALNTALGSWQELKAERNASSLQQLLRIKARVKRAGIVKQVDAEALVPGDIVLLESGVKVPADLRLTEARNLSADESFLTGESLPSVKKIEILESKISIGDRKNMAFAGSTIQAGRGIGVVVATGGGTQVGKIASNVAHSETAKPPLVIRMEKFTTKISIFVLVVSLVLGILLYLQGNDITSIFFLVVALAVSVIPEGLPVAMTVALSIATSRMAKRNVIVRKLTAVESLGSCTVIASDKTGTLTLNEQTVKKVHLSNGDMYRVSGVGYNGEGEITPESYNPSPEHLGSLIRVAILANESSLHQDDQRNWIHMGDSMDVALMALAFKQGIQPMAEKLKFELISEIPYESELKYSAAIYTKEGKYFRSAKGAVETILSFCEKQLGDTPFQTSEILKQANQMAEEGLRVLAFAGDVREQLQTDDPYGLKGLTFLGLVGFQDPLRPGAKEAVLKCKSAGIKVIMITGDHPATAASIAQELEPGTASKNIVTGTQLDACGGPDTPEFKDLVQKATVFARVSPIQKQEIVDVLIRSGEFVAVTGDGVNDTPAMRRANIGVAMGSGTDAAKETGAMIITDDHFASIVAGVEEGRFAYDNVRKVIYLLISAGTAEVLIFAASIIAGLELPFLAVQLLWLNLVTNGIQDVALAFEAGEPGAMKRKPRQTNDRIFNPKMMQQTLISGFAMAIMVFGFWYYLSEYVDIDTAMARNITLLLMVCLQNFHVFNCRSESRSAFRIPLQNNRVLIFGVIAAQGLHIFAMQLPIMQNVLSIQPVSFEVWAQILICSVAILLVMEAYKAIKYQLAHRFSGILK